MGYHGDSLVSLFSKGPQEATKRCAEKLADKGGHMMTTLARAYSHRDTGELVAGWYQLPVIETMFGPDPAFSTGAENNVEHAPYQEYGTKPHEIRPKDPGGALHWIDPTSFEDVFAKVVHHPGTKPVHMLARATLDTKMAMIYGPAGQFALDEWAKEVESMGG